MVDATSINRRNRRNEILIFLFALFFHLAASAAPTNFVLLVECSPRMALRKDPIIDIAREIISSGVQERIQRGQIFEVWFYDDTIQADAVRISWDPALGAQFGKLAADRIAVKRFNIPANLPITFPSLRTLLKNSGDLTVFILTDGFQPLALTPFDEQINREMIANRDAFYQANEPFLVTLLGRNGEWIGGGIHSKLNSTIDIPEFPKPKYELPPSLQAIAKKEKTNAPVEVAAATPPPQPAVEAPPPKRPDPDPVLEKMLAQIAAAKAAPKPEPKIETPTPPPIEKPAPEPVAIVETNAPPTAAPPASAPTSIPAQKETAMQAAVTPQRSPSFPWPILLAIFGLIAAGGVFAYLRMKEAPPKPRASLISQAYNSSTDEKLPRLPGSPGMRIKINLPPANPPVQKERPKREE